MVLVPSILRLGVHPRVASSTSAFNYIFISITNLITLMIKNLIPIEVTLWFGGLAFIGGSIITKIGYKVIEKYKISYIVIFIVVLLAFLNAVAGIWYILI